MYDRELNNISFEMNNLEENFGYGPTNYDKPVYKRYSNLEALESEFEEQFESLEEHFKKKGRLKNLGKKIKGAAKKIGAKIKEVAKKLNPEDALFLPLIPMKAVMRKILDKKKISYGNGSIKNLVKAFYSGVVKKGKNFESEEHFVGVIVSIVKEIVMFFKANKDAADAGTAGAEEAEIAAEIDNAANVADDIDEADIEAEFSTKSTRSSEPAQTGGTGGGIGLSTNTILILVVAVVGIYFVSKKS